MKLNLSIQSYCKQSHHLNLQIKIEFIEKTCPNDTIHDLVATLVTDRQLEMETLLLSRSNPV